MLYFICPSKFLFNPKALYRFVRTLISLDFFPSVNSNLYQLEEHTLIWSLTSSLCLRPTRVVTVTTTVAPRPACPPAWWVLSTEREAGTSPRPDCRRVGVARTTCPATVATEGAGRLETRIQSQGDQPCSSQMG